MKKTIFPLLIISLLLSTGCTSKKNDNFTKVKEFSPEIEKQIDRKRDSYDICYDHDTSSCTPFFDSLLKKGLITKEEILVLSEKTKINRAELEQEKNDPSTSDKRKAEIARILYGHYFTEDAKSVRQEALNRYYNYVGDELEQGVSFDDL
jgi:hypothetical protein